MDARLLAKPESLLLQLAPAPDAEQRHYVLWGAALSLSWGLPTGRDFLQ
jgi:hypothetical protein